jgi:putative acetyltransferase
MWVAPTHRRRSVGKGLVEAIATWAQSQNATSLCLMVTSNNESAMAFYQRLGFARTGRTEPYPNDPALIEYEMCRSLRAGGADAIVIEQVTEPTDEARMLISELDAELSGPYTSDQRHGLSVERIFQPQVMFFIARQDGEPVGCGGVSFENGLAEVKRMYVRPQARGRGIAGALLARLIAEAQTRAATQLVLETGDAQHAAIRFYERAGFRQCGSFGAYATMPHSAIARSVFLEKQIR